MAFDSAHVVRVHMPELKDLQSLYVKNPYIAGIFNEGFYDHSPPRGVAKEVVYQKIKWNALIFIGTLAFG